MDVEALPEQPPPFADPGGVPIGTTLAEPPPPAVVPTAPVAPVTAPSLMRPPPVDMARLSESLTGLQRHQIESNERLRARTEQQTERDQARVEAAYKQTGVNPGDMKPWDQEAAREEFRYDPIAEFGSIGSIFAQIASAFTKAPMTNAMMGSAAAMNAAKANNALEYDRAYKSWQDNYKLAVDRQRIQHQAYQDAVSLMNTNMQLGEARMRNNLARFGDQRGLLLLENGMNTELLTHIQKQNDITIRAEEAMPKIMIQNLQNSDFIHRMQGVPPGSPQAAQIIRAWKSDWTGGGIDENGEMMRRIQSEEDARVASGEITRQQATDNIDRRYTDFARRAQRVPGSVSEQEVVRRAREIMDADPTKTLTQARDEATRQMTAARTVQTPGRAMQEMKDAEALRLQEQNPGMSRLEAQIQASRNIALGTAAPSGNRLDDIDRSINRIGHVEYVVNKVEDLLKKHNFITGLGGTVARPMEIVSNAIGASNETDRVQFARFVAELKEMGTRVLTDSNGRPLSAEVANINRIIAGMNAGDTAANTARAYYELRQLLTKMKTDLEARRGGVRAPAAGAAPPPAGTAPPPAGTAAPPGAGGAAAPWANDPVVQ